MIIFDILTISTIYCYCICAIGLICGIGGGYSILKWRKHNQYIKLNTNNLTIDKQMNDAV